MSEEENTTPKQTEESGTNISTANEQADVPSTEEPTPEEKFSENPEVISLQKKLATMSKTELKDTTITLREEISDTASTIKQLKNKRAEHNSQARHYRQMRNNITDKRFGSIQELREEAAHEKELRDHCNEQIQKLKDRRDELNKLIREAWGVVKELREDYYDLKDEVGMVPEEITQEIRDLEWKQQTTPIPPEEDAELTKRIAELYEKAYAAHSLGVSSDQIEDSVEKAKRLSQEHDEVHEKVLALAEESQEHHKRMIALYEKLDELHSGGSDLHEKYLEARQAADAVHQRIVDLYERIQLNQFIIDLLDDEKARRRFEKIKELKKEKISKTKEKQSSGKKLTLNELRLLMGETDEEMEEETGQDK
ncbi:MAG: hypothetical protein GF308_19425 [Candidatus Heimdallarchaeota archaeon]|nr:hypothetical protein [Candidatus Heimdallarchaeota archaeon]